VKFDLQLPPKCKLIAQPPADLAEGDAAMLHYTWGSIWKDDAGKEVWSFDKRFYTDAKLELEVMTCSIPDIPDIQGICLLSVRVYARSTSWSCLLTGPRHNIT